MIPAIEDPNFEAVFAENARMSMLPDAWRRVDDEFAYCHDPDPRAFTRGAEDRGYRDMLKHQRFPYGLVVVAGPPNGGKTIFARTLRQHLLENCLSPGEIEPEIVNSNEPPPEWLIPALPNGAPYTAEHWYSSFASNLMRDAVNGRRVVILTMGVNPMAIGANGAHVSSPGVAHAADVIYMVQRQGGLESDQPQYFHVYQTKSRRPWIPALSATMLLRSPRRALQDWLEARSHLSDAGVCDYDPRVERAYAPPFSPSYSTSTPRETRSP